MNGRGLQLPGAALALLLTVAGGMPLARAADPAPGQPAATPVGIVTAELKPIDKQSNFVGRIEAPEKVEIRARVKGFVDAVLFKEGDTVAAGAPLYRIEKSEFEATVEQAEGARERAKASLDLATIQRQRAEDLYAKNVGSAVARDQAIATEAEAKGALRSADANLNTARINLGYTDITAPIAGRIGRTAVTKGAIVGPDSGVLTTIVSQNPMYVVFPISQRDYIAAQQSGLSEDLRSIKVRVRFADGSLYDQVGQIDFVDVSVNRSTDTVILRAVIPNPKNILTDGQLVQVALQVGEPQAQVSIPQAALIADQKGLYVFAVEDGKAVVKRVTVGGENGADVVIESGVKAGDQIVVDGLQMLRPGTPVLAQPAPAIRAE
ncbi:efflux RND transporter periplasmic adaptor subunit [Ancylobacter terrae]|uniref:efflux RND transporter periplasmic adaptor subunit n=1 Tax=Ancylobacter sp. sgz301288 TaxID=3342077 RepID=UPI00385AADED